MYDILLEKTVNELMADYPDKLRCIKAVGLIIVLDNSAFNTYAKDSEIIIRYDILDTDKGSVLLCERFDTYESAASILEKVKSQFNANSEYDIDVQVDNGVASIVCFSKLYMPEGIDAKD